MKLLIWLVACTLSFTSMAQDYACKDHYLKRIDGLIHTQKKFNSFNDKFSLPLLITEFFLLRAPVHIFNVWISAPATVSYLIGSSAYRKLNRMKLDPLIPAQLVIEEAFSGKEAMIQRNQMAFEKYQLELATEKLEKKNQKRKWLGQRELSLDEYLASKPLPVWNGATYKSPLSVLQVKINQDRGERVSYVQLAEHIRGLAHDDTFCPKNRPVGLGKLKKILEANL